MLFRPNLLEPANGRGRQSAGVRPEQCAKRFGEIASRNALEVKDRDQHLQALRTACIRRQHRGGDVADTPLGNVIAAEENADLANYLSQQQALEEIEERLSAEDVRAEERAQLLNLRASIYFEAEDCTAAQTDFDAALALDSGNAEAHGRRGLLRYACGGDHESALESAEIALRIDPQSILGHYARGHILLSAGESEAALQDFESAIRIDENSALGYWGRALYFSDRGELENAVDDLERVIQLDTTFGPAYALRGYGNSVGSQVALIICQSLN